eukprot:1142477-Pelagomonas_calceolata.AAC.3
MGRLFAPRALQVIPAAANQPHVICACLPTHQQAPHVTILFASVCFATITIITITTATASRALQASIDARELQNGDIVNVDVTAQLNGYCGDLNECDDPNGVNQCLAARYSSFHGQELHQEPCKIRQGLNWVEHGFWQVRQSLNGGLSRAKKQVKAKTYVSRGGGLNGLAERVLQGTRHPRADCVFLIEEVEWDVVDAEVCGFVQQARPPDQTLLIEELGCLLSEFYLLTQHDC